ncbi:Phage tail collar domain containing protein, partial [uncultured Caudovirales phage]
FSNAQMFSGITLDTALQRLLLISQQNKSYALGRNLSYIVNSYIPSDVLEANVQVPILSAQQVWMGSANGIIAATLEQNPNVGTLRSELANNSPDTDGALLIGYYDPVNTNPTTVDAQLTLLTNAAEAAVPSGTIIDFAGSSAPSGFLVCDGSAVSRSTYTTLFSAIGTIWGEGDGSTTFNLPALPRTVTMGSGGTGTEVIGNEVGDTTGSLEIENLTDISQIPLHSHTASNVSTMNISGPNTPMQRVITSVASGLYQSAALAGSVVTTINPTGGSPTSPFNIIQTSAIVLKCIKT